MTKYKITKATKNRDRFGVVSFLIETDAPLVKRDLIVFVDTEKINQRFYVSGGEKNSFSILPILKNCNVTEEYLIINHFVIVSNAFTGTYMQKNC